MVIDGATDAVTERGHAHSLDLGLTLDFLNTSSSDDDRRVDQVETLDAALDWFVERGVIHVEGADRTRRAASARAGFALDELRRIHRVRAALREVAQSVIDGRTPDLDALDVVNRTLHARQVIELVPARDGVGVDHRHVGDPVDDALARLTDPLVAELTTGQPERIRQCAGETCAWFFYDTSRTQRRRWCDMSTCGNRAKVARFRARARVDSPTMADGSPAMIDQPSQDGQQP
jgi:predicted RNA-binding Zn ribbon-like protein